MDHKLTTLGMTLELEMGPEDGVRLEERSWKRTLLVEDNSSRAARPSEAFIGSGEPSEAFTVTLHRIGSEGPRHFGSATVGRATPGERKSRRIEVALSLLGSADLDSCSVVTAGPAYGGSARFLGGLTQMGISFAVEIPSSQRAQTAEGNAPAGSEPFMLVSQLAALNAGGGWVRLNVRHPVSGQTIPYAALRVGRVRLCHGTEGWLTVLQTGAILNSPRGAAFVLASEPDIDAGELVQVAGWVRWIRPHTRKQRRPDSTGVAENSRQWSLQAIRPAAVTEPDIAAGRSARPSSPPSRPVRVVELFAGAGGMGLGFFMAKRRPQVRLLYSGEVHPVYAETLRANHAVLAAKPKNHRMGFFAHPREKV
jgi:hypothetical protein